METRDGARALVVGTLRSVPEAAGGQAIRIVVTEATARPIATDTGTEAGTEGASVRRRPPYAPLYPNRAPTCETEGTEATEAPARRPEWALWGVAAVGRQPPWREFSLPGPWPASPC